MPRPWSSEICGEVVPRSGHAALPGARRQAGGGTHPEAGVILATTAETITWTFSGLVDEVRGGSPGGCLTVPGIFLRVLP
jgi:hypothetical protein